MECLLEANPSPEVTWFQGNKVIADSSRVKMTRTPLGKDTFSLALEILNPTKEDGGNYRCNACNAYGESNANIALNFQGILFCPLSPAFYPKHLLITLIYYAFKGGDEENSDAIAPTFIEKPKIVPNESGTLITMKCKCRAKPAPVVTWFKESTQVTESSRFKMKCTAIESDVYELVLEIKVRNSELDFLNSTKLIHWRKLAGLGSF